MKEDISNCILVIVFCLVCIGTIYYVQKKQPKQTMYKIEFEKRKGEYVTVWVGKDGLIKKADKDPAYWSERVVINPHLLGTGKDMVVYGLLTDAIDRESYFVLKVEKEEI